MFSSYFCSVCFRVPTEQLLQGGGTDDLFQDHTSAPGWEQSHSGWPATGDVQLPAGGRWDFTGVRHLRAPSSLPGAVTTGITHHDSALKLGYALKQCQSAYYSFCLLIFSVDSANLRECVRIFTNGSI